MKRRSPGGLTLAAALLAPVAAATLSPLPGCGARTGLFVADAGFDVDLTEDQPDASAPLPDASKPSKPDAEAGPEPECEIDDDCVLVIDLCNPTLCREGKCVPGVPVVCDDKNPCTRDSCDPATGKCSSVSLVLDLDRDGHFGPAPGTKVGDPDACGDDCDDTSAKAFPGNVEVCDGVDNDCNGVIDDNMRYSPVNGAAELVSEAALPKAEAGGLAYRATSKGFLAAYTGEAMTSSNVYLRKLDKLGKPAADPEKVNGTTGDAYGGPIAWTGDRFGMAWSDRRDGDYEIYFNTFNEEGQKLGPDVRISATFGFSINPSLVWSGNAFFVAWQDDESGKFEIKGQQITLEGVPVGVPKVLLGSAFAEPAEAPSLAADSKTVGLAYRRGNSNSGRILIARFTSDLVSTGAELTLAEEDDYATPSVSMSNSTFFVTFERQKPFRLYGAMVASDGTVKVPARELSPPGGQNRGALPLSLGDRVLLVYSRQSPEGYDMFSRLYTDKLDPLGEPEPITASVGDDFAVSMTFGDEGDIGVLFTGRAQAASGLKKAAYFTRLRCAAGM